MCRYTTLEQYQQWLRDYCRLANFGELTRKNKYICLKENGGWLHLNERKEILDSMLPGNIIIRLREGITADELSQQLEMSYKSLVPGWDH